MTDARQQLLGLIHRQLQMLRRNAVAECDAFIEITHPYQRATGAKCLGDDVATLHARQQLLNGRFDGIDESRVWTQQDGAGLLVVLGLGKQIHGYPFRWSPGIAQHQDLRGPRDHVDADGPEKLSLGFSHIGIAGSHDLIHRGHGVGPEGQRRHRLGAADAEHGVHAGDMGGCQHEFIELPVPGRHGHDHLADTGDAGGYDVHQHRRRIGRLTARHINTDAIERRDLLPEQRAVRLPIGPGILTLALVVGADALGGEFQSVSLRCVQCIECRAQTSIFHSQSRSIRGVESIESPRVFEERRVAARPNVLDYFADDLLDAGVALLVGIQKLAEVFFEIPIIGGEPPHVAHGAGARSAPELPAFTTASATALATALARLSMIAFMGACFIFMEALLAIKRELMAHTSSTSTKPLAASVPPVSTTSTMQSARPTTGASSMEPYSLMISACTPAAAKKRLVLATYLVATRGRLGNSLQPRRAATTKRQRAMRRSRGS